MTRHTQPGDNTKRACRDPLCHTPRSTGVPKYSCVYGRRKMRHAVLWGGLLQRLRSILHPMVVAEAENSNTARDRGEEETIANQVVPLPPTDSNEPVRRGRHVR